MNTQLQVLRPCDSMHGNAQQDWRKRQADFKRGVTPCAAGFLSSVLKIIKNLVAIPLGALSWHGYQISHVHVSAYSSTCQGLPLMGVHLCKVIDHRHIFTGAWATQHNTFR